MNGNSFVKWLSKRTSTYRFNLAMGIVALITLKLPLQRYMILSRNQHVGIAIFLFGMGFVMQLIWSWRTWTKWAKISNCATSAFFCSVGLFFYSSKLLDNSLAEPTAEQNLVRSLLIGTYLFFAFMVAAFWVRWIHEDAKLAEAERLMIQNATSKQENSDKAT